MDGAFSQDAEAESSTRHLRGMAAGMPTTGMLGYEPEGPVFESLWAHHSPAPLSQFTSVSSVIYSRP